METKENSLNKLLEDLYSLTKIKLLIVDEYGNEKKYYPTKYTPFCALLRQDKDMDNRCKECDKKAYEYCKKTKNEYSYICHAGLYESFSPILYNGNIVGFIGCGQIKAKDSKFVIDKKEKNYDKLLENYNNLPLIDDKTIKAASNILKTISSYEYQKAIIETLDYRIDYRINEFINEHLSDNLSVELLCSSFHLSRNELYLIFERSFQSTPAEYIKLKRIEKACELLKETSYQVSHIGAIVGFPDYNYFSKVFKKEMSISPRKYRKNK